MKGLDVLYAEVIPTDLRNEARLIKAAMALYPEYSKKFQLVFEFLPGRGIKLYVEVLPSENLHEQEMRLVSHGVGILKKSNIQGSVQTKQLDAGHPMFQ